uniref:Uncharacterized protein n=1 Tax=Rhizophora mucronata TaxID=61149 RepID=A0A2P2QLK9_RHIMU
MSAHASPWNFLIFNGFSDFNASVISQETYKLIAFYVPGALQYG